MEREATALSDTSEPAAHTTSHGSHGWRLVEVLTACIVLMTLGLSETHGSETLIASSSYMSKSMVYVHLFNSGQVSLIWHTDLDGVIHSTSLNDIFAKPFFENIAHEKHEMRGVD